MSIPVNIACLQRSLLSSFTKRLKEYASISKQNKSHNTTTTSTSPFPITKSNNSSIITGSGPSTNTGSSNEVPDSIAQYIESRAANPTPIPFHGTPSPTLDNAHQRP